MSNLQNLNESQQNTEVDFIPIPYSELSPAQQYWVDYCALQGLVTNDDGSMKKMTIHECANNIGVSHQTLYDWKKSIPNFNDLVVERCKELWSGPRTVKVVNSIFVNATVKLNVQAQALWMANQKSIDFRMPQHEVKHQAGGGFADLLERARSRAEVVEGEVVSEAENKNTNA